MIEAVAAMGALLSDLQSLAGAATAPPANQIVPDAAGANNAVPPSFMETLQSALGRVDDTVASADATAKSFSAGDQSIPLSDVMVSLEQANLAMQMASGVRDKFIAAYTNIMNMQV